MTGSGLGSHGFTGSWVLALPVPVRKDESPSLQVLGASSLALWMRDKNKHILQNINSISYPKWFRQQQYRAYLEK